MATAESIRSLMTSGSLARLIPVVADTSREQRITSSLLATFMVVPEFGFSMLTDAGAPSGKRSKIEAFTEVVLKPKGDSPNVRPDGLILVTSGKKCWSALVEAKISGAELKAEQIEEYLDLAKAAGIDAVVTISNQFATRPNHHPVQVSKVKTRTVELYHFSWLSLVARAIVAFEEQRTKGPEQAFILNELLRHMEHDASGVLALTRMGSGWKEVCAAVQHGAPLKKNDSNVESTIFSWHQLSRYLAVALTSALGRQVKVALSRQQTNTPGALVQADITELLNSNTLSTEFDIPNAAARVRFCADLTRRTIIVSMRLDAPKDRSRPTAAINWLLRQLRQVDDPRISIWAHWPRRTPTTMTALAEAREDPNILVPDGVKDIPNALEVVKIIDLAGRFRGAKTFVEDSTKAVPDFYHAVGQNLTPWIPKPPKMRSQDQAADDEGTEGPPAAES